MSSLIPDSDLQRVRMRYLQEHPAPARAAWQSENDRRAGILVEIAREDGTITVQELAEAAERQPMWVRRVLQKNGILAPEAECTPTRRSKAVCQRCGHTKRRHCDGVQVPRLHRQKRGYSICRGVPHCAVEGCPCVDFVKKDRMGQQKAPPTNVQPNPVAERAQREREFMAVPTFDALCHLALEQIQPLAWGKNTAEESRSKAAGI